MAASWDSEARLYWEPPTGGDPVESYFVYRSTTSGSGYSQVAGPIVGLQYVDATVTNGTPYYYVVTAFGNGSESNFSNQATAVPGPVSGGTSVGGTISGAVTWRLKDSPFTTTGTVTVQGAGPGSPAFLTLEPGVEVRLGSGHVLKAGSAGSQGAGVIISNGAAGANVRMIPDGAAIPGAWGALEIWGTPNSTQSLLRHTTVEYAGGTPFTDGAIYLFGDARFEFCTILGSAEYGINSPTSSVRPTVHGCTFQDNTEWHLWVKPPSIRGFSENVFDATKSGGDDQGILIGTGTVEEDATWQGANIPYIVDSGILRVDHPTSGQRANLTLEAGTRILFGSDGEFFVGGTGAPGAGYVSIEGTAQNPVIFEPTGADWVGMTFVTDPVAHIASQVQNAIIRNAGSQGEAVSVFGTTPTFTGCTIEGSSGKGIVAAIDAAPIITGCVFQNNADFHLQSAADSVNDFTSNTFDTTKSGGGGQAINLTANSLSASATWEATGIPYRVDGSDLTVRGNTQNVLLSLQAGCEIQIGTGYGLWIGSTDPGPDGLVEIIPGSNPEARTVIQGIDGGTFLGVLMFGKAGSLASTFDRVDIIRGGEAGSPFPSNLYVKDVNAIFRDCSFSNGLAYGARFQGPNYPTLERCDFSNNTDYHVLVPMNGAAGMTECTFDAQMTGGDPQAIDIDLGQMDQTGTWEAHNVPYRFDGDYVVNGSNDFPITRWILEAGAVLALTQGSDLFIGDGVGGFDAFLQVKGGQGSHVELRPWVDGQNWGTLYFNSENPNNFVNYCDFIQGGDGANPMVRTLLPGVDFNRCEFRNGAGVGLANPPLSSTNLRYCSFSNNALGALEAQGTSPIVAELCWWSAADGPGNEGPGSGQGISGNVDFDPYFTTPIDESWTPYDFALDGPLSPGGADGLLGFRHEGDARWNVSLSYVDDGRAVRDLQGATPSNVQNPGSFRRPLQVSWDGIDLNDHPVPAEDFEFDLVVERMKPNSGEAFGIRGTFQVIDSTIARLDTPLDGDFYGSHNIVSVTGTAAGTGFTGYSLQYQVDSGGWQTFYSTAQPVIDGPLIPGGWDMPEVTGSNVDLRLLISAPGVDTQVPLTVISPHTAAASPSIFGPNGDGYQDTSTITSPITLDADWQIVIYDGVTPVRTVQTGLGLMAQGDWDGLVDPGVLGDPGTLYSFRIEGNSTSDPGVTFASDFRNIGFHYFDIASPLANTVISSNEDLVFTGTAAGQGFAYYDFEYAWASTPDNWVRIQRSFTQVEDGVLGTWTVPETVEGGVTFRVRLNSTDEQSQVPLEVFAVYQISASPNPFAPNPDGNDDTSAIAASLTQSASQWRILIYDQDSLVREVATGSGLAVAGAWDGLVDPGVLGEPGRIYQYEIEATHGVDPGAVLRSNRRTISFYYVTIDSPVSGTIVGTQNDVDIIGTAKGTGFANYTVEWRLQSDPGGAWNLISTGNTEVENDILATWTVPVFKEDAVDIRVVWSGGPETAGTDVSVFSVFNPLAYDHISPNNDGLYDTTPVEAQLTLGGDWSVRIFDDTLTEVWTRMGTGTSIAEVWDGKDNGLVDLPEGAYTWRIDATSTGDPTVSTSSVDRAIAIDTTIQEVFIYDPAAYSILNEMVPLSVNLTNPALTVGYKVSIAPPGTDPSTDVGWTDLFTSGAGFTSNPIYDWATRDAGDGDHLIRVAMDYDLDADLIIDETARHAVPLTVDNLVLTFLSVDSRIIDVEAGDVADITFNIDDPATVKLQIYDEDNGINGTLFKEIEQTYALGGDYTLSWDGTDAADLKVLDEAYVFVFEASDIQGRSDLYNPPGGDNTSGGGSGGIDSNYNPYANDFYNATYNISSSAEGTRPRIRTTSPEVVWLVNRVPHLRTEPVRIIWDGRGVAGQIIPTNSNLFFQTHETLRPHFLIVRGNAPRFGPSLIVKTDPWVIHLSYGHVTHLKFDLLDDANVTVKILPSGIYDPADPSAITLMSGQPIAPGEFSLEWDGMDPSDPAGKTFLFNSYPGGDLTFTIEATNPETGVTTLKRGAINVFE